MSNYFNQWKRAWPVVALIGLAIVGAGMMSAFIAVPFGLFIEATGLVERGEDSYRWAFYAWCAAMIVTFPVQMDGGLRSWYRDRFSEEERAEAVERARIDAENQDALESGGEAALARLRNDRFMAEQKRGLFAAFR